MQRDADVFPDRFGRQAEAERSCRQFVNANASVVMSERHHVVVRAETDGIHVVRRQSPLPSRVSAFPQVHGTAIDMEREKLAGEATNRPQSHAASRDTI